MSFHNLDQTSSRGYLDPPKVKKLRLSCDGCLGAKVKCTKHRPVCGRCTSQGISCIYSESRRAGRRGVKGQGSNNCQRGTRKDTSVSASSLPECPIGPQISWDDEIWPSYLPNDMEDENSPALVHPPMRQLSFEAGLPTSLDSLFHPSISSSHGGALDMQHISDQDGVIDIGLPTSTSRNTTSITGAEFINPSSPQSRPSANCLQGIEQSMWEQGSYSRESFSSSTTGGMGFQAGYTPEGSIFSDSSSGTETTTIPCTCLGTLQDRFHALDPSVPPFDQFISTTKSAVTSMMHCLSCSCLPDISVFMLLSLTITRLVQWHKQISRGDCQAYQDVGVIMGSLQIDKEDEHRIKHMLIRSELIKIRSLVNRFRGRFENYMLGNERQVFEASVDFLESELNNTIDDL